MNKKYQIFVNSTYHDLREEREQVIKAVLEMGHIPVGMEMFSAADEEQWKIIARQIDEIDYYAVIVAHRYGSVTDTGISYTEKEYDYAVSKGVPVLGFIIYDSAPWPKDKTEDDARKLKKLVNFKEKMKGRLVQFWRNKDDLHGKFSIALKKSITANPRTGWARADEVSGPEVMKELARLSGENAGLRSELQRLKQVQSTDCDAAREVIRTLSRNGRRFKVRKTGKWDDAPEFRKDLGELFSVAATEMISEAPALRVAQTIALRLVGTGYFADWPVPRNVVKNLIADWAALDLVEPSKRRHSVSDTQDYWSLTHLGKSAMREFRRVRLEEGLSSQVQDDGRPEEESGDTKAASEGEPGQSPPSPPQT